MPRGGKREGAGRKTGSLNLLTQELREKINAEECISFLQNVVAGGVEGSTVNNRIDAAIALLKKTMPDCKQTKVESNNPIIIKLTEKEAEL